VAIAFPFSFNPLCSLLNLRAAVAGLISVSDENHSLKNIHFRGLVINFATVHDFVKPVSYAISSQDKTARPLSLPQRAAGHSSLITTETQNYA